MDKKRFCKNILGLALLPLCISTTIAFAREAIEKNWTPNLTYFFLGAAVYLFIHLFFHKPIVSYVAGHELTHALWGLLFGARIKKMKVSKRGGSVAMTRTNILVNLAPYIFPIYTFLIMILYFLINLFWSRDWMTKLAVLLIGLTFSFHIVLSLHALRIRQSDLNSAGILLSTVCIYLANIFVLIIIFTLISHRISLGSFFLFSAKESGAIYRYIIDFLAGVFATFKGFIGERHS